MKKLVFAIQVVVWVVGAWFVYGFLYDIGIMVTYGKW